MSAKTVFISYRRDATGKAFANLIEQRLTNHGYDVFLDVRSLDAGQWALQILSEVPNKAHFLLLLTPGSLDRCENEDDWVRREFMLAVQHSRNIVPVREESVDLGTMSAACPESMKRVFKWQAASIRYDSFEADIQKLIDDYIPPDKAPVEKPTAKPILPPDTDRILRYVPDKLIGREAELALLDAAWAQVQANANPRPHVMTFVALGGEGKTSLVAHWTAALANQGWPGCTAAFAWSFYSQGTREQAAASSDLFLREALIYFGDAELHTATRRESEARQSIPAR